MASTVWGSVKSGVGKAWTAVRNLGSKVWQKVKGAAGKVWTTAKDMGGKAWDMAKSAVDGLSFDKICKLLGGAIAKAYKKSWEPPFCQTWPTT